MTRDYLGATTRADKLVVLRDWVNKNDEVLRANPSLSDLERRRRLLTSRGWTINLLEEKNVPWEECLEAASWVHHFVQTLNGKNRRIK